MDPYEARDLHGGDSLQVYFMYCDPKEENKGDVSAAVSWPFINGDP